METGKTAVLVGATGLIGQALLNLLLADPTYSRVHVVSRRQLAQTHPKLEVSLADLSKLAELQPAINADAAFCCLGTTMKKAGSKAAFYQVDFTYVLAYAKACLQGGVSHFSMVTAMGANKRSPFYYNQVKGEIEEAIIKLGFPAVHIFQPSLLLGKRNETRLGEDVGKVLMGFAKPFIPKRYIGIEGAVVARAMLAKSHTADTGVFRHTSDLIHDIF